MNKAPAIALLLNLIFASIDQAQVPQILNYQGRVSVNGTNFDGIGLFQFALVSGSGADTYWSNGDDVVPVPVTAGLYSVLLGDPTIPNMDSIPATVFTNADVRLRVWFDGGNGLEQLTPDQRLVAVGYALTAGTVPDGAITSNKLAAGAVTSAAIADGAIGSSQVGSNVITGSNIASNTITAVNLASGVGFVLTTNPVISSFQVGSGTGSVVGATIRGGLAVQSSNDADFARYYDNCIYFKNSNGLVVARICADGDGDGGAEYVLRFSVSGNNGGPPGGWRNVFNFTGAMASGASTNGYSADSINAVLCNGCGNAPAGARLTVQGDTNSAPFLITGFTNLLDGDVYSRTLTENGDEVFPSRLQFTDYNHKWRWGIDNTGSNFFFAGSLTNTSWGFFDGPTNFAINIYTGDITKGGSYPNGLTQNGSLTVNGQVFFNSNVAFRVDTFTGNFTASAATNQVLVFTGTTDATNTLPLTAVSGTEITVVNASANRSKLVENSGTINRYINDYGTNISLSAGQFATFNRLSSSGTGSNAWVIAGGNWRPPMLSTNFTEKVNQTLTNSSGANMILLASCISTSPSSGMAYLEITNYTRRVASGPFGAENRALVSKGQLSLGFNPGDVGCVTGYVSGAGAAVGAVIKGTIMP